MMNYDRVLSQLADDKLTLFPGRTPSTDAAPGVGIAIEDGAVEEEQAAAVQTVQFRPSDPIATTTFIQPTHANENQVHKTEVTTTPQRKISTSARFMNAFQQFYTSATSSSNVATTSTEKEHEDRETDNAATIAAAGRTPTKGMESKLLSMWHNVKYGWSSRMRANFSKEQPVWLLGRCYHRKYTPPVSMDDNSISDQMSHSPPAAASAAEHDSNKTVLGYMTANTHETPHSATAQHVGHIHPLNPGYVDEIVVPQELGMDAAENQVAEQPWEEGIEGFRRDFYSRIWMTYRREFPTMNGSNYTSDCGWGCMLRSGQMMLAQGLICHFLGRSWRYDAETQIHSTYEDNLHKKIIKWFGDSSSKTSPFSIHALVSLGEKMGKKPGDWYGPASVSYLLKQALKNAAQENADFDNIIVYVAKNCTIYMQDIEDECTVREPTPKPHVPWYISRKTEAPKVERQHWKSLIVMIPLRLGTEKLNPIYAHCLKLLLSTEYCIGIIGGRPRHSLYFVGFQEDKLIHLDPHYCQEMVDVSQENFSLTSFHCKSPRKLKAAKMDPSCCIGFYCQTKTDFENFVESVQLYLHPLRCASGTIDKIIPPSQQLPTAATANFDNNAGATASQLSEMSYPLFTFSRGRCLDHEQVNEMSDSFYKSAAQQTSAQQEYAGVQNNAAGCSAHAFDDDDGETEEFVLL